jgi:AraC family transcriptional regulator
MNQLEWATLHRREVGGIEVQLRHFTLSEPFNFYDSDGRATLGFILPPYPSKGAVQYDELGSSFHDIGRLHLTPPYAHCRFSGSNDIFRSLSCLFDAALFQNVTHIPGACNPAQLMSSIDIGGRSGGTLDVIMRRMAQEVETPGFAPDTMIEGLGLAALAELAQHLNGQPIAEAPARGRLSVTQVRLLQDYVNDRTGPAPSISELAQQCGIGRRRFMALFRATTGQTVRTWVDAQRMQKAQRLLTETRLPLKVIAFDLGFANQGVFSTAFKRMTGVSPSDYRNGVSGLRP